MTASILRGIGLPHIHSIKVNTTLEPSNAGSGNTFIMAMLALIMPKSSNIERNPPVDTLLAMTPMVVMGPPMLPLTATNPVNIPPMVWKRKTTTCTQKITAYTNAIPTLGLYPTKEVIMPIPR